MSFPTILDAAPDQKRRLRIAGAGCADNAVARCDNCATMKADMNETSASWLGRSIERVEDAALLSGHGRFIDDLGVRPGTLHAAILRSPHAHAVIRSIKTDAARRAAGVYAIVTGAEVMALSSPLLAGVKAPVNSWPIAVDRVRYAGEPVAVAVATDRYRAEDALDLI